LDDGKGIQSAKTCARDSVLGGTAKPAVTPEEKDGYKTESNSSNSSSISNGSNYYGRPMEYGRP